MCRADDISFQTPKSHLECCISRCKGFWKSNKVLSVNCVQKQRVPKNATLGSGANFSGLLLKVQILASHCKPTTEALHRALQDTDWVET